MADSGPEKSVYLYATYGSSHGDLTDRINKFDAWLRAVAKRGGLRVDGESLYDAATIKRVRRMFRRVVGELPE